MDFSKLMEKKATPWLMVVLGFFSLNYLPAIIPGAVIVVGITMLLNSVWPEKWDDEAQLFNYVISCFMQLKTVGIKKKRAISIMTIIIAFPFSIMGAASNSLILGGIFGFLWALGIDSFIDTFRISE